MSTTRDEGRTAIAPEQRSLDRFESSLLAELRTLVSERPVVETRPILRPDARRIRRGISLVAAAAAAVAAVAVGPHWGASPAFAVTKQEDGDIAVTIHRLEDAKDLEKALADQGVTAEVDYDADPGDGPLSEGLPADAQPAPAEQITPGDLLDDECMKAAESVDFGKNGSDYQFTIKAGSILNSKVLHVTIASDATWSVTYYGAGESDMVSCGVLGSNVPTS